MTIESVTIIPASSTNADESSLTIDANSKMAIMPNYENVQIVKPNAEQSIDIIELQANATLTPDAHDSTISDTCSDTTGYLNTIQTGTTTATFSTNKYVRNATPVSDAHGVNEANNGARTTKTGMKITCKVANTVLLTVTNHASSDATKCYLCNDALDILATADYAAHIAVFNYALVNGTSYYILEDKAGASYSMQFANGTATYPISGTNINWIDGYDGDVGSRPTWAVAILSITTATDTQTAKIIDITLPAITGTVTATELLCSSPDLEIGSSITYSIKDAGANTQSGLAYGIKNTIATLTTNPINLKIYLNPKTIPPTNGNPSVKTFCLKVWK